MICEPMPCVGLQCGIVAFPDHTHFLINNNTMNCIFLTIKSMYSDPEGEFRVALSVEMDRDVSI